MSVERRITRRTAIIPISRIGFEKLTKIASSANGHPTPNLEQLDFFGSNISLNGKPTLTIKGIGDPIDLSDAQVLPEEEGFRLVMPGTTDEILSYKFLRSGTTTSTISFAKAKEALIKARSMANKARAARLRLGS